MALNRTDFISELQKAKFVDGRWNIRQSTLGMSDTIFVNFINAPTGVSGADVENNRLAFSVSGFSRDVDEPVEKLRCELIVRGLIQKKFRTRSAKSEVIIKEMVSFCELIDQEVPPKLWNQNGSAKIDT